MADPFLKQGRDRVEGVVSIREALAIKFDGGIDISKEPSLLPLGGFSAIVNMRPMRPGFDKRKGCIRLHTIADTQ